MAGRREQPLDPGGGAIVEFAAELRRLRQEAGNPSYEAMAKRVTYGRATLHAAARGHNLPSRDVALAFVRACGGDERAVREWARRWESTKARLERDMDRQDEHDEQDAAGPGAEEPFAAGSAAGPGSGPGTGAAGTRREALRPLAPEDPRRIGGFTILRFLGAGAMGRVYLGESLGGRKVAIKVINGARAGDEEFRARFRQEIAAARRVHGMFTAAVVASDPEADDPWLATEYVAGPSLQEVVGEQGPMPVDTVIRLAAGVAEALAAIHGAGVVHRDLKPGNVLVAGDGPKVIDFGIARTRDATTLTRTQMLMGTPGYVAPERLAKGKAGPECDVFSLGALLAFASTGRLPFGSEPSEIGFRIVHGEPDLEPVPEQLRELVAWCLAKDPDARPSPGQVLDWCCERAGQPGPGWLPAPLTGMIRRRAKEAADVRAPDPEPAPVRSRPRTVRVALATAAVLAVIALVGALMNLNPPSWGDRAGPPVGSHPTGGATSGATAGATSGPTGGTTAGPTGGTTSGPTAGTTTGPTGGTTGTVTGGPTGGAAGGTGGQTGGTAGEPTQGTSAGSTAGATTGSSSTQGAGDGPSPGTSRGTSAGTSQGTNAGTSSGTSQGTSAGTSAGTSVGTSQGTNAGTSSGTSQGTSQGPGTGKVTNPPEPILMGTSVHVQPRSDTVDCTRPIVFTFSATARRTGTIGYTWYPDERLTDRGYQPRAGSMTFTTPNTQYETFEVRLQGTQSGQVVQGEMAVQVGSPEVDRQKVGDQFHLTCA
ncbi:protein kinase domain-containing protein [Streptomyces lavendulocolor]|uniref:protein kinase domain-containing protein n=1 Tax=Streptomyces lavendulocolor TaxID=67316 RepID=UPI0033C87FB9